MFFPCILSCLKKGENTHKKPINTKYKFDLSRTNNTKHKSKKLNNLKENRKLQQKM